MSVILMYGDIFDSECQALVNPVNCRGRMGKGLALEFKRLYPKMYDDYIVLCAAEVVKLGKPYIYKPQDVNGSEVVEGKWVINFPTKGHWNHPSKVEYIHDGLEYLMKHYLEWGVESLAVPALGCGNGGLNWSQVAPLLYGMLGNMPIKVELYRVVS